MQVHHSLRGASSPSASAGLTLIELMIATVVMVVAVGGLSSAVVSSARLNQVNEETAVAHDAARRMAGEIQVEEFAEIFARFNADPDDDPATGPSPGPSFAVDGLAVQPADPDGFAGEILFPTSPGGSELREDEADPYLGMPRDLNGDGVIDVLDHSGDYVVLPVTVRVQWRGATGNRTHELHLLLVE